MRRLPVYLLIDTSGSMKGEPIEAVNAGLQSLISSLRRDPQALETAHLSIITFDREARLVLPLTPVAELQLPSIVIPDGGPTMTGAALELLCQRVDSEVRTHSTDVKRDWKPLLFIMTDGSPSDVQKYNEMVPECKKRTFAAITACAAGMKAKIDALRELATNVVSLDTCDGATFAQFFQWVSASISSGAQSVGVSSTLVLPPPPEAISIL
jgi:uncharacterized protein YegL